MKLSDFDHLKAQIAAGGQAAGEILAANRRWRASPLACPGIRAHRFNRTAARWRPTLAACEIPPVLLDTRTWRFHR